MLAVPEQLAKKLRDFDQDHVLAGWDRLDDDQRSGLLRQLQSLDLSQLRELYGKCDHSFPLPPEEQIKPAPVVRLSAADAATRRRGEEVLTDGAVAVLLVAGGQGSRLGFDHPKGMFPIGPVTNKSLFQIHAEKVLALRRRYGSNIPLLVMTSPATHAETEAYFAEHRFFGLRAEEV